MNLLRILLSVVLISAGLLAQAGGTLTGKITDARGAGVPNAIIIVTDSANRSQRVVSAPDGTFTVNNLAPGSYQLDAESGAMRSVRQTIDMSATGPLNVEIKLAESNVTSGQSGVAEIRATTPMLQTDSAEVSRTYGSQTIRSLPVLDRQAQELIGLMPGVTPPVVNTDRILDPQRSRMFNVNGQPAYTNVHHQEGTYDTEAVTGQVSRIVPNESIEQLNVRTSNYNAEYGFAGGAWSNLISRAGANSVHGSVFEFNTNSFFTTRNPLNSGDNPEPRFNINQFGGTIGGPIAKDVAFLFLSYDGMMRRGNELRFATVPTADLLAGNFAGFPGLVLFDPRTGNSSGGGRTPFVNNRIPVNRLNPTAQALLPFFPAANLSGSTNNFVGNSLLLDDTHRLDGRMDYRFSDKTMGFLRYGFTHGSVDRGSILGPLGDAASSHLRNHNAIASVLFNVAPTLTGELRFGFSRYRNAITPFSDSSVLDSQLATNGFMNGLPQITIGGFGSFGSPSYVPSKPVNNTYNPSTNWVVHTGMHKLKIGAEARRIAADGFDPGIFGTRGSFLFGAGGTASATATSRQVNTLANSFAAFLVGAPSVAGVSNFLETPTYRQTQYAGYITDTINLWQRFYLELGVRYDAYSPVETRHSGGATIFDPTTGQFQSAGLNNIDNNGGREWDLNNIAPRVGFAFRPVDRIALRGGYGIHYFPVPLTLSGVNFAMNGVQTGINGGLGTVTFATPTLPASVPQAGSTAQNIPLNVSPTFSPRTPYIQTYSLMVQADMGQGFLFDIGYVGSTGRQLPYSVLLSAAEPGTGLSGLPFANRTASVTEVGTGLTNNYNSLQVNLTKRLSRGLAFAGAYTFSKALDRSTSLLNPFDRAANYGVADWDRTHMLSVSHVWTLPFGAGSYYVNKGVAAHVLGNWELNGMLRWATGTPYTITADPLLCQCPGLTSIPGSFNGTVAINGQASFDPSLFSAPASGSFGNAGRNTFRGPDLFTYNLGLFRNFPIYDKAKIEFRAEVYNLTNTTNFANPVSNINAAGFGQSFEMFNGLGGRQFQLAARILF